jgi:hypothetical protein
VADQISVNGQTTHTIWQAELIERFYAVTALAKAALADPQSKDNPLQLQRLIDGIEPILGQIADRSLTPPDGRISFGIGRFVSDWVDDLGGPLSQAVSATEFHYTQGAAANATYARVSAKALSGTP